MTIPYEGSTTGTKAREEIIKILRGFGCENVGFMDEFADHSVLLAFTHRGRQVQLRASAKGWANLWLKEHPYNSSRSRMTRQQHEAKAIAQGLIAINSILRDWVKGQVTAMECGILSFEEVMLPYMLDHEGVRMIDRVRPLMLAGPAGDQS